MVKKLPNHPYVIQINDFVVQYSQSCIVMELCEKGSLEQLLYDTSKSINEEEMVRFGFEIAAGLYHLHKNKVVHRNLAARNVLLTKNYQVKIADFGLSKYFDAEFIPGRAHPVVPVEWMAPEGLRSSTFSEKSDVWSYGIVLSEIVNRREPFPGKSSSDVACMIRDQSLVPTNNAQTPALLITIMELCWKKNPEDRPTFDYILSNMFKRSL